MTNQKAPRSGWGREVLLFAPVYFCLSFIQLRVKLLLTPAWFDRTLAGNHLSLLRFDYYNNEQSRILQFLIPEFLHQVFSLSIEHAYIVQRWLFFFTAFILFHLYLRKWFRTSGSFAGVLFMAAVAPLTYMNDLQESAPLLLVTFLGALWAIRERNTLALILAFLIGGLNNETMLVLPLAYLTYNITTTRFGDLLVVVRNALLVSLPLVLTVGPIRWINRNAPHLAGAWQLPDNLRGVLNALYLNPLDWYVIPFYLGIFLLFGMFWIYAFVQVRDKPLFLRRVWVVVPFFIAAHLVTGVIHEVRQMLPLSFIIIPMALFYLLPAEVEPDAT